MVVLTYARRTKKRRKKKMVKDTFVNVHLDSNFNLMARPARKYILVTGRTTEDVRGYARRMARQQNVLATKDLNCFLTK